MPSRIFEGSETIQLLQNHDVTSFGFLPSDLPLAKLPTQYFNPWESLTENLPGLIRKRRIRAEIDHLPLLDTSLLKGVSEWRRAYVILSFLAHSYVWGGDDVSEVLPASVSIPLVTVSKHLDLPPVATYASLNLWNYTSTSSDLSNPDNLTALHTFTGTEDESWFYVVSVAMEAEGGSVISKMLSAINAVEARDYQTIITALQALIISIGKLSSLLQRMYEKCDPMVFFHQIRPFLAGSKNMEKAGLPNGVFYSLSPDGKGEWKSLRGGSNGQSSLIQLIDAVLGVDHKSEGKNITPDTPPGSDGKRISSSSTSSKRSFHTEVRDYMPGPHRRFLQYVSTRSTWIRDLAMGLLPADATGCAAEHDELRMTYSLATLALSELRNKHLQIVTRYIILPSKQAGQGVGLAKAPLTTEAQSGIEPDLRGTGGTSLLPFLKQTRDETVRAGQTD